MLQSEAGVSGATGAAQGTSLPALRELQQHFPEHGKTLQGDASLRLWTETLIKQLNCQSQVTLKVSRPERKHNGAMFVLTTQGQPSRWVPLPP